MVEAGSGSTFGPSGIPSMPSTLRRSSSTTPVILPRERSTAQDMACFDNQLRLPFVDVDLLPVVERDTGMAIKELIEGEYARLQHQLGWTDPDASQGHWMLQTIFWLVSAKMLHDKGVETFSDLDLLDVTAVLDRVGQHHSAPATKVSARQLAALADAASTIAGHPNLRFATTEALAFVYENAMITKAIRDELGTHSTPPYLVRLHCRAIGAVD